MPAWVVVSLFTFLGATFGSFFNVVAWRLPLGMSLSRPRSHCPKCGTSIPWYRNLPVATWVLQRGRCAWCACVIPPRYVLVELFCALLGLGWAVLLLRGHWANPADAAGWIVFALAGVPVALIDWDTFEIPDGLVVVAGAASVFARMVFSEFPVDELAVSLRAGLLACGLLYAISFLSRVGLGWIGAWARSCLGGRPASDRRRFPRLTRLLLRWSRFHPDIEALGLGDVSLGLAAGAALGFPAIFLGLPFAAIFGIAGWLLRPQDVAIKQTSMVGLDRQALPFGPFLVAGFLMAALLVGNGMQPPL